MDNLGIDAVVEDAAVVRDARGEEVVDPRLIEDRRSTPRPIVRGIGHTRGAGRELELIAELARPACLAGAAPRGGGALAVAARAVKVRLAARCGRRWLRSRGRGRRRRANYSGTVGAALEVRDVIAAARVDLALGHGAPDRVGVAVTVSLVFGLLEVHVMPGKAEASWCGFEAQIFAGGKGLDHTEQVHVERVHLFEVLDVVGVQINRDVTQCGGGAGRHERGGSEEQRHFLSPLQACSWPRPRRSSAAVPRY
eukprot:SAG11_NODE_847_length_6882_cov_3.352204_4_plen_253_part_00